MQSKAVVLPRIVAVFVFLVVFGGVAAAQAGPRDRILQPIEDRNFARMRGNVSPHARPDRDQGSVDDTLLMERVTLFFKRAPAQEAALEALLEQQQDPASPNYHQWLTPERFAEQFGLSRSDFAKAVSWLQGQGFTVVDAARSRTWVAFNGTAAQVATTFRTPIHQFLVNGEMRYANVAEPAVPSALADVVLGIRYLNNFRLKPKGIIARKVNPEFTSGISGSHFLAPDDFATIYDLKSLYSSGTAGAGQKIAIMGQTDIVLSDIATFRSVSKLPASTPQVILVPGSADPGVLASDIVEADLDLEWAGAVAFDAKLVYVNSKNGVFDSLQYAVGNNVAPVISISYGDCEANFSATEVNALRALAQQANAQGQTILASSGDSGAADCDFSADPKTPVKTATHGLAVDIPAAIPFVTGAGGSEFNEGTGSFWNTTNNSSNGSAISYIPEMAWNDTAASLANGGGLAAGGGGKSTLFAKPSWQVGPGVPADGSRDVPDVSLNSSAEHDGYLICSQGSCVNGYRAADNTLNVVGGTSAAAPALAGIVALINQKTGSAQGNINPRLYQLAASTTDIFHDILTGDNKVPCTAGTKDCPSGGSIGFDAGPGYDQATGLGSVAAFNLVSQWGFAAVPDFQLTAAATSLALARGGSKTNAVTVGALNGFTGSVTLTCSVSATLTGVTCTVTPATVPGSGTATLTVTSTALTSLPRSFRWTDGGALFAFGILLGGKNGSKEKRLLQISLILVLAGLLFLVGCGGTGAAARVQTPTPLSGVVTIQAVSGTLSHSLPVSVTVN